MRGIHGDALRVCETGQIAAEAGERVTGIGGCGHGNGCARIEESTGWADAAGCAAPYADSRCEEILRGEGGRIGDGVAGGCYTVRDRPEVTPVLKEVPRTSATLWRCGRNRM